MAKHPAPEKHVHYGLNQYREPEFFFRGGGTVLKPNHITRYEYPCPLHYSVPALYLQAPINAAQRSRPQGRGDFGPNGAIFLTITHAHSAAPTHTEFQTELAAESVRDGESANPLGMAMARITDFPGNTLLQSGKFRKRNEGYVYVVKRTSSIPLQGGSEKEAFGREEEVYVIKCSEWRGLRPKSRPGHDSWWQRLWVGNDSYVPV
jgi:hypothetical protein